MFIISVDLCPVKNESTQIASLALMVEQLTCNEKVGGSNPSGGSKGLVAQLVRATPCHGVGRGFEPLQVRKFSITVN